MVLALKEKLGSCLQVVHLFGGVKGGEFDFLLGLVFQRLEVQGVDFLLAVLDDLLVESLARLAAQVALVDQVLDKRRDAKDFRTLVVGAVLGHAIGDMHQGVDADHVACAERRALGPAHGRAGQLVHGFHRKPHVLHGVEQSLDREDPHAVGDEGRRVLAQHRLLSKDFLAVSHEEVHHFWAGVGRRNDLKQLQVPRRIEEVRAAEVRFEIVAATFHQHRHGNAAGVGGDVRAWTAVLLHLFEELLLDVQTLHNHFQDPIALGNLVEVVVEVAGLDAFGEPLAVDGGGFALEALLEVPRGDGVAGSFLGRQVQEQHLGAALGDVACDGRTHHA